MMYIQDHRSSDLLSDLERFESIERFVVVFERDSLLNGQAERAEVLNETLRRLRFIPIGAANVNVAHGFHAKPHRVQHGGVTLQVLNRLLQDILSWRAEHREVIGMEADAHIMLLGIAAKLLELSCECRDWVPISQHFMPNQRDKTRRKPKHHDVMRAVMFK
ncbi:hypothetical protein D3C85_1446130 [compost metagenome]